MRRILGSGDRGRDVFFLQQALNWILLTRMPRPRAQPDWRSLSKRWSAGSWGYFWAPGAYFHRRNSTPPVACKTVLEKRRRGEFLRLDGIFGPKTEAAVRELQCLSGIPQDGIVGPETWEILFPFWTVSVWIPNQPGGTQPTASTTTGATDGPKANGPFIGSPYGPSTLDNAEFQAGLQRAQSGDGQKSTAAIFVLQFTWKTETTPNEIVPGHWEHTGGAQVGIRTDQPTGNTIQFYYQLTRAELVMTEFIKNVKLILIAPFVQPYIAMPLDLGTNKDPNVPKIGATTGNTISLEANPGKGAVTLKVFCQGTLGASISTDGSVGTEAAYFCGAGVQVSTDALGKLFTKSAPPAKKELQLSVDPQVLTLTPGTPGKLMVRATRNGFQGPISLLLRNLPAKVTATRATITSDQDNREMILDAAADAGAVDTNAVWVEGSQFRNSQFERIASSESFQVRVVGP